MDDFDPRFRRLLEATRWGFEAGFLAGVRLVDNLSPEEVEALRALPHSEVRRYLIAHCEAALTEFARDTTFPFDTTPSTMPDDD